MSVWVIVSWVFVILLTGINIFVFFKLKQASEQMMKMAFPGAKNMNEALQRMQQMTQGLSRAPGGNPFAKGGFGPAQKATGRGAGDAQLKAAMEMLQQMQKGKK